MRISDWSSDVCSSDLTPPDFGNGCRHCRRCVCRPGATFRGLLQRLQPGLREVCLVLRPNDRAAGPAHDRHTRGLRSEEHTSELQSLMRISYAVFCLKKKNKTITQTQSIHPKSKQPLTTNT